MSLEEENIKRRRKEERQREEESEELTYIHTHTLNFGLKYQVLLTQVLP